MYKENSGIHKGISPLGEETIVHEITKEEVS